MSFTLHGIYILQRLFGSMFRAVEEKPPLDRTGPAHDDDDGYYIIPV